MTVGAAEAPQSPPRSPAARKAAPNSPSRPGCSATVNHITDVIDGFDVGG